MRRSIVLGAVALAVVAGFVGQQILSDDEARKPEESALFSTLSAEERGRLEAEQMRIALEEQKKLVIAAANPHELVVTIRDELPLDIWDTTCHMLRPGAPALVVSEGLHRPLNETRLPSDAEPLAGGGCEATVKVAVPDVDVYSVGVVFEGNGIAEGTEPQPPLIKHKGDSQRVTIVE